MKRLLAVLFFLLLLGAASAALGEPSVTVDPENPRVGDYVEVTVIPGRENRRRPAEGFRRQGHRAFPHLVPPAQ